MAFKVTPNYEQRAEYLATATRLHILNKPRTTYSIEIIEDPEEPWFIYAAKVLNKGKNMKSCSMLIRKDIPDWIRHYEGLGWVLQNN